MKHSHFSAQKFQYHNTDMCGIQFLQNPCINKYISDLRHYELPLLRPANDCWASTAAAIRVLCSDDDANSSQ